MFLNVRNYIYILKSATCRINNTLYRYIFLNILLPKLYIGILLNFNDTLKARHSEERSDERTSSMLIRPTSTNQY